MTTARPTPEALFEHAEFLSRLATGLLGDEHAAADVVQDAYVAALERPPADAAGLRGWLARVVQNRAFNARRSDARRRDHEAYVARGANDGSRDDAFERLEVQRKLLATVLALDEPRRTVLYLRYYEDLSPTAIAARLDLPVKTVKSRLARGLATLRERLDADVDGGRDVWLSALAPIAMGGSASVGNPAASAAAKTTTGILGGMAMKEVLLGGAALVAIVLGWQLASESGGAHEPPRELDAANDRLALPVERDGAESIASVAPIAPTAAREALVPEARVAPPQATGTLRFHLVRADGTNVSGMHVLLVPADGIEERKQLHRATTDAKGDASFANLLAGDVRIYLASGHTDHDRTVAPGETTAFEWRLPTTEAVRGRVVDDTGAPVADAEVWLSGHPLRWPYAMLGARTDASGAFDLIDLDPGARIGARASGRLPSIVYEVGELGAGAGGVRDASLVLGARGGGIRGRVLDPGGAPVAGALVHAGEAGGYNHDGPGGRQGTWPEPVPVATDANGAFELPGGYEVRVPLHAQAHGYPTWSGRIDVPASGTTEVEIRLADGAIVEGVVTDAEGRSVSGARVICATELKGGWYEHAFPAPAALTEDDGTYRLELVPPGLQDLNARGLENASGRAYRQVPCKSGEVVRVDFTLDTRPHVSGHVVGVLGNALVGWRVSCQPAGPHFGRAYPRQVFTDASGAFLLPNVGEFPVEVSVYAPNEWAPARATATIDPGTEGVELIADDSVHEQGSIEGVVLDEDGVAPRDATLAIYSAENPKTGFFVDFDPQTGHFLHGPIDVGGYTLVVTRATGTALVGEPTRVETDRVSDAGVLQLEPLGRIELTLTGFAEEMLERVPLSLDRPFCNTEHLEFERGLFVSPPIVAGEWQLSTRESELFLRLQSVHVVSNEIAQVEAAIRLAMELLLELEFADDDWDDVTIVARDDAGVELARQVWFPAHFRTPGTQVKLQLPLGTAHISAATNNGLRANADFEIGDLALWRTPQVIRLE